MKRILPLLVLFLAALACETPGSLPTLVPTPIPLATAVPTVTNTPPPTSDVVEAPTATEGPNIGPVCVRSGSPKGLGVGNYDELPADILNDLNQGLTGDDLFLRLDALSVGNQPTSVAVADFTGDGFFDVAVSVFDRSSILTPKSGRLLIYNCTGNESFELAADIETGVDNGYLRGAYLF
jgi:hypothetical protein